MNIPSKMAFLELCEGAPLEKFALGEVLIEEGKQGGFYYFILSGSVGVELAQNKGGLGLVPSKGAGELIGELSLSKKVRSANVVAQTNCEFARTPHAVLLQIATTRPSPALALLAAIMEKVIVYRSLCRPSST